MSEEAIIKKFMYVNRKSPYGTIYALESLEVVLISAAFDQDVSLAFIDDGVFQLKKNQDTSEIYTKNFSKMQQGIDGGGGSGGLVRAYALLAANVFALTAAFGVLSRSAQIDTLTSNLSRENQAMFDVGQAWRVSAASQLLTPRRATGRCNKSRH